jgi:hypothetical protein
MISIRFTFGSALLLALFATASLAGTAPRTWVSGSGSDFNACTHAAPCRNFNAAIAQTASGGEVVAMDSACYQPISIFSAVTVEAAPGVYAGITATSWDGISVFAGAQDTVILRGLTIKSQGSEANGITFGSGAALEVENCTVDGFGYGFGLYCGGGGAELMVTDSVFTGSNGGILIDGSLSPITAVIDGVRLEQLTMTSVGGVNAFSGSNVVIKNSTITGFVIGAQAESDGSSPVDLDVENCIIFDNSEGIGASDRAGPGIVTVRVSNSTVTDNYIGLVNDLTGLGALLSRTNNTVEGNSVDEFGPITTYIGK